uniref:Uncharacterized protein n=1 Tax=uncultured Armatimonadetes bacterium TaxID=157466 RepID=A0A6J4I162_9BACT|nr:hypothetical protein AVDCRST_MAG63-1355 [uncultured Armatimonadetes bacterium]
MSGVRNPPGHVSGRVLFLALLKETASDGIAGESARLRETA